MKKALIEDGIGKIKISFDLDVYFRGIENLTAEEIENLTVEDVFEAFKYMQDFDADEVFMEMINNSSIEDVYSKE